MSLNGWVIAIFWINGIGLLYIANKVEKIEKDLDSLREQVDGIPEDINITGHDY